MNRTQDPNGNPLDPRDRDGLGRHEEGRLSAGRDGHDGRFGHEGRPGDHVVHDSTIERDHHNRRAGHIGSGYGNPDTAVAVEPVRQKGGFGLGLAALIIGILAFLTFWFPIVGIPLGIAAIIMGLIARGRARRLNGSGRGLGIAGAIFGVLALILSALAIFGAVQFLNTDDGKCIQDAGGDQAKIEQCSRNITDKLTGR